MACERRHSREPRPRIPRYVSETNVSNTVRGTNITLDSTEERNTVAALARGGQYNLGFGLFVTRSVADRQGSKFGSDGTRLEGDCRSNDFQGEYLLLRPHRGQGSVTDKRQEPGKLKQYPCGSPPSVQRHYLDRKTRRMDQRKSRRSVNSLRPPLDDSEQQRQQSP